MLVREMITILQELPAGTIVSSRQLFEPRQGVSHDWNVNNVNQKGILA